MGRWLALLSTASLILGAAVIDPCKRQPFRGRCPSVEGQAPKRSQFVLRYYARNGECVSYPYGHCASDESEPQLYRYKEECEDSCINNTPENLGQPKTEESQTYGTVSPLKEPPTAAQAGQKTVTPERVEPTTESTTAPPTIVSTTGSSTTAEEVTTTEATTTEATTTETVTTTTKITTTVEAITEAPTTIKHDATQIVTEKTDAEEEKEINVEEEVQETTIATPSTTQTPTTSSAKTECERRREASASSKIRGGFVPVCDSNGNFQKIQCEPDGRQCFCVSANGIEITNSRTRNGVKPDCARIETAIAPRFQACTGRPDRGPCSSAYTRFYFDESTQKCNTFSYSGCGGNGNNYETEVECNRRCMPAKPATTTTAPVANKPNDICGLPKERGPCTKYELRFYYNDDTKECKYFFWGGCEGNGNNFETAESCQSACGVAKVSQHNAPRTFTQNSGPIKTIPGVRIGNGSHDELEVVVTQPASTTTTAPTPSTTRLVPQAVTTRASVPPQTQPQTTQRFIQPTTAAPQPPPNAAPVSPPRPKVVLPGDDDADSANRCAHPLDSGSCRGTFVRWFWDNRKNACDVFTYSGCEGNGNNFASKEECMAICHKELVTPPPAPDFSNVCKHDIDAGECQGVFQRFAFDTEEDECRPFTYGGCGGNGNNFATIAECRTKCEKPEDQAVNVCEFEIEAGECTGVFPRFAYDRETNDCRSFTYGGCGGNGNNFANINECRNVCIRKSCQPVGQCDLGRCQIVNDNRGCPFCSCSPVKLPVPNLNCAPLDINRCQEPCIVITNRRGCQECTCPKLPSTVVPPVELPEGRPPGFHTPQTARPPATPERVGPPASPSRPSEPVRPPMTIPGIQENRLALPNGIAEELTEKCMQPMESGPCKNFVDRWFFNKEDGSCHPFKYGGCAGNRNHFFTQRECEIHCARFLREASAEASEEEEETPRRRIVAAGVSQHHDVVPLPVENYKSPEPPLRGAYGKKLLEPATTQGVKIVTSTARPSTPTTTPTTTTTKATTTTAQVEEKTPEDASDEMEEGGPGVTTTVATTTAEVAKEKTVVSEIEKIVNEQSEQGELKKEVGSGQDDEDEEEPEEFVEPTTVAPVPTSRATRLSAEVTTPEETEEEEEEPEDVKAEATNASEKLSSPEMSPTTATESTTSKTTLINEVNNMEGEEGVDDNEITPPSMQSSSKFAVHRQTEEVRRFEEFSADARTNEPVSVDQTSQPLLKKVEITRPTTADPTSTAPTTAALSTEVATQTETTATPTTTAEQSTTAEKVAQNIEITESTTATLRTASTEAPTTGTTQAPTTSTTTQARLTNTESDLEEAVPDFDESSIKKEQAGVSNVAVEPEDGVGRQPIPIGSVNLPENTDDIDSKGFEEPTTIFPVIKGAPTVRLTTTQTPTARVTLPVIQNTPAQAQTTKKFDSHDPRIICAMPADSGICDSYVGRWFFNSETGQCEQFSFGGCGGNHNNFVNRTLCELSCMTAHPALTSQVPERCSYDKDAGYGKGYNVKWYFNMRNLRCEQFVFEGKGGNSNQFETLSDCERFCSPQPARSQTTRPTLSNVATVPTTLPMATRPPQTIAPAPVPTAAPPPPKPLAPLPIETTTEETDEYENMEDDGNLPSMDLIPPVSPGLIPPPSLGSEIARAPGTEPQPPAAQAAKTVTHNNAVDANKLNTANLASAQPKAAATPAKVTSPPTTATTQKVEQTTYKTERINTDTAFHVDPTNLLGNLPIVGPSPPEFVNYQTGQVKAHGLPTHDEGRLPPPDIEDAKNGDVKVVRPSCPNGNKELRYSDGRSVQCLPGKQQCPDKSVCYFNGMDYFCCPTTEDPYDRHVFGGYGGEEARNGYKVFGPLRIRRLMDEVPLRAKRQTSMDRAFNTNPVSFNLDSVVAPLRFDAEKPKHVFSAARMRKPTPPRHGNPMCILPLIKGDCDSAHLRYYYDRNSDSCRLFYYSGCQGNANNFGSLEDCQRLCVLGGQIAPAVQSDAVTPANIVSPGQCPNGSPLGGSAPVLCGNSTESIGCPTGFYCRSGPPDICCPGVDPNQKNPVQHGVKVAQETTPKPGVPRSYYKQQLISTPQYMCPDASDPLMAENGMPAVCGAGFDGVKMCPKGYYCAIDGAKGSRLCCPLFGSTAHRIPTESILAPQLPRRNHNPQDIIDRGSLPSDQQLYDKEIRKTLPEAPVLVAKTSEAPEYEEDEEEDDDDAQHLKMKPGTRHEQLQNEAASQSPNITEISSETVNIDVSKEQPAVEETVQPTEAPVKQANDKSTCQLKPTEGRACREDEKAPRTNLHYFYSAKDRRCKLYFYRGCGGNANRFEKKAECEALCLNA